MKPKFVKESKITTPVAKTSTGKDIYPDPFHITHLHFTTNEHIEARNYFGSINNMSVANTHHTFAELSILTKKAAFKMQYRLLGKEINF